MLIRTLCILLASTFGATNVAAQTSDDPPTDNFRDRSQAITILLDPSGNGTSGIPGDTTTSATNCRLGADPVDLSGGGVLRAIGANLSRHCDGPGNITAGSVLGGGLLSLGATRTVSQPVLDEADLSFDEAVSSRNTQTTFSFSFLSDETAALPSETALQSARITGLGWRGYAELLYQDVSEADTVFSNGVHARGWSGVVGVAWDLSPTQILGVEVSAERLEGRSVQRGRVDIEFVSPDVADPSQPVNPAIYEGFCGVSPGGSVTNEETGASLFGSTGLSDGWRLGYAAGFARIRQNYDNSVCIISDAAGLSPSTVIEVFAGRVAGRVAARNVAGSLTLFRDISRGRSVITPSLGVEIGRLSVDGYTETETPGSGTSLNSLVGYFPSGTALTFDPREVDSIKGKLGLGVQFPLDRRGRSRAFINAVYVHEFGDGQQRISARFSEDGRPDPFRFSFLGAPTDRDYGEISAGVSVPVGRSALLGLRAQALVGHSFSESVSVAGSLTVSF